LSCLTQARRVAESDDPVLLTGESGTGKELFAQAIHNTSARRNRPFIPINCGGLSDELLGAELFGYVEGAFTGATRKGRLGKFRSAHGGTLFLDEVEAMSPRMQSHLLRVLEEKRVFPVGSEDPFEADVRVIAATNVDLTERINEKSFREDLYYRLSCHTLRLPPLRERRSDIALLVQSFLATNRIEVTPSALGRMEEYCWPGNVRELRNVLAQARQTVSDFIINDDDFPAWPACHHASCRRAKAAGESEPRTAPPTGSLQNTERETILRALRDADNNHGKAAVLLGVSRATLYRKLKRHRIRPDYF
jgi:transcriptional regulator with PAS, ATPase and Fis domain